VFFFVVAMSQNKDLNGTLAAGDEENSESESDDLLGEEEEEEEDSQDDEGEEEEEEEDSSAGEEDLATAHMVRAARNKTRGANASSPSVAASGSKAGPSGVKGKPSTQAVKRSRASEQIPANKVVPPRRRPRSQRVETDGAAPAKRANTETESRAIDLYKRLECPVCFESPRSGPIYNCSNGHVLCKECVRNLITCPVCRDPSMQNRNLVAEELLGDYLKVKHIKCRSAAHGCDFEALLPAVALHEESCGHSQVSCMRRLLQRQGGNCKWTGKFSELESHLRANKCAVMNVLHPNRRCHFNTLGDGPDNSIFATTGLSEWRPSVMVSRDKDYGKLLPYLTTYRDNEQNWFLFVRAFGGPTLRSRWRVRITVRKPSVGSQNASANAPDCPTAPPYFGPEWSFRGELNGHEQTDEEIRAGSNLLRLNDDMVRKLCVGRRLLDYFVELEEVPQLNP